MHASTLIVKLLPVRLKGEVMKGFNKKRVRTVDEEGNETYETVELQPWEREQQQGSAGDDASPKGLRYAIWKAFHPQRGYAHMAESPDRK